MSDINQDIIQMTGIGVMTGMGLTTMKMVNKAMDPKPRRRRRRR